jgi:RNA polymerase sigma-70 factor (ECF subfamily)
MGRYKLPSEVEEQRVVLLCKADADSSMDLLYRNYGPALTTFCRERLHWCTSETEDAVHETILRAQGNLSRFRDDARLWPWLATIAANVCSDVRRHREREFAAAPLPLDVEDVHDDVARRVDARVVARTVSELPPQLRTPLFLREFMDWTYSDIAEFLGVSVPAVRTTLMRARRELRTRLLDCAHLLGRGRAGWAVLTGRVGWLRVLQPSSLERLLAAVLSVLAPAAGAVAPSMAAPSISGPPSSVAVAVAAVDAPPSERAAPVPVAASAGVRAPGAVAAATARRGLEPSDAFADGAFWQFTASPSYQEDRTVFATGAGGCATSCVRLLRSDDGGETWHRLAAAGLQHSRLLLPPAYPRDPRLLAASSQHLWVSHDGGQSFEILAAAPGLLRAAVMSPLFSAADPRILMVDGLSPIVFEYRDDHKTVRPLDLALPTGAIPLDIAFSSSYAADGAVLVQVSERPEDTVRSIAGLSAVRKILRCAGGTCTPVLELERQVRFSVASTQMPHAVIALDGPSGYRSVDGGRSFQRFEFPRSSIEETRIALAGGPDESLYQVTELGDHRYLYVSPDAGRSWNFVSRSSFVEGLTVLPDGTMLTAPHARPSLSFACSLDGGRTWKPTCSATEPLVL